ncbi:c-type cytochrome [Methylococcus capsulatus]|uniref:c-type cytochrome n=1 Tax=Methylococcus capsulatus TaxID=414 RepID=UPI00211B55F2|nr:cytochrome c family protein [Methylococcus capsulatus]
MTQPPNTHRDVLSFVRRVQIGTIAVALCFQARAEKPDTVLAALGCLGCHADEEEQIPELASLRRFDAKEMASLLREYREGKRSGTVMNRIAAGLTNQDIEAIAGFLGKRP